MTLLRSEQVADVAERGNERFDTGSREVEHGRSMRDWMERMGLAVGGETARTFGPMPRANAP